MIENRLKKTEATGIRQQEAKYINLSLTTLGCVVSALEEGKPHIPFRGFQKILIYSKRKFSFHFNILYFIIIDFSFKKILN